MQTPAPAQVPAKAQAAGLDPNQNIISFVVAVKQRVREKVINSQLIKIGDWTPVYVSIPSIPLNTSRLPATKPFVKRTARKAWPVAISKTRPDTIDTCTISSGIPFDSCSFSGCQATAITKRKGQLLNCHPVNENTGSIHWLPHPILSQIPSQIVVLMT